MIPNEQLHLRYAVSHLSGSSFDQVVSFINDDTIDHPNTAALICILEAIFGDLNRYV